MKATRMAQVQNGLWLVLLETRIGRACWLPALILLATTMAVKAGNFTYTTNSLDTNTITIAGYTGPGGAVVIPSNILGKAVTSIGDNAFAYCASLTSVTIPDGVTNIGFEGFAWCTSLASVTLGTHVASIGHAAFDNCTSLANITIPASVTRIGPDAFAWCASLTSVSIPSGVISIGDTAFSPCTNLSAITVSASNSLYSSVAGVLFNKGQTTLIQCPGGAVGIYTVSNNVTSIGRQAFAWCTRLSAIAVGASNSAYSSVAGVLFDKDQTTLIQCPAGTVGTYSIPAGVTSIEDYAFAACSRLTNVTIPSSVTSIGFAAFQYCTYLPNITIPASVTSIWGAAFEYCSSLTSVAIPDHLGSINAFTFWSCTSLTNATIPNSVTSIGDYAFADCTSLTGVTIPNSVISIGDSAFYDCTSLTSVTMDNGVISIGYGAFEYCANLTSVTIPNSVISIGDSVFYECASLASITVGNRVASIGDHAFMFCTNLAGVYFLGDAPSVGSGLFSQDDKVPVYYLPGTTGWDTFGYSPTVLWNPHVPNDANFGVRTNCFGFTITGASNLVVVVEACTNLLNPAWSPVGTNTLADGSSYFGDSQWINHNRRFYRFRTP